MFFLQVNIILFNEDELNSFNYQYLMEPSDGTNNCVIKKIAPGYSISVNGKIQFIGFVLPIPSTIPKHVLLYTKYMNRPLDFVYFFLYVCTYCIHFNCHWLGEKKVIILRWDGQFYLLFSKNPFEFGVLLFLFFTKLLFLALFKPLIFILVSIFIFYFLNV